MDLSSSLAEISILMIAGVFSNAFIAVTHTLKKEKIMIQEGGEPLPTSSYVFLVLKYLIWAAVFALCGTYVTWTPADNFLATAGLGGYLIFVFLYSLVTYIITLFLEVFIRLVTVSAVYQYKVNMIKNIKKHKESKGE